MRSTRTLILHAVLAGLLAVLGAWLWRAHAEALDLGRGSSVLSYDAAQYAVAARELAEKGRLATPFALPIELVGHPRPPWPLALVQPGLVVVEAAVWRLGAVWPGAGREGLVVLLPFVCFLATGMGLAIAVSRLIGRHAPDLTTVERGGGALAVGLAFLLDPEAQHYAAGGFTEIPFTFGLAVAIALLAREDAWHPFGFGLLLGATGLFRGNMLWLAPILAGCLAWAWPGRRIATFARVLAGYAVVLSPWWVYKAAAFGNPAWDLSALSVWDGVGGRTWFSLNHLPEAPDVPTGMHAVVALARKLGGNVPTLLLQLATGPRTLWIAALAVAAVGLGRPTRADANPGASNAADDSPAIGGPEAARRGAATTPPAPRARAAAAAAAAALLTFVASVLVASLTVQLLRYVAPARLVAEAAGLLATWAMLWRMPSEWMSRSARRALCVGVALLAVGWGGWQTLQGLREARVVSGERGTPTPGTLASIAATLDARLAAGEPVMSNLGPALAWYARRPVIHLALTPADVDACRRHTDFRVAVLAFRDADHAWSGWSELMRQPSRASANREWNVATATVRHTSDGFTLVWLELGPLAPPVARDAPRARGPAPPG